MDGIVQMYHVLMQRLGAEVLQQTDLQRHVTLPLELSFVRDLSVWISNIL